MKRDYSLDFLRAMSCILVIIIHVANVYCRAFNGYNEFNYLGAVIFNGISRISVPIFFMISGALLIKEEFNMKKYFKRIFKLIYVLAIWNLIYFIFNNLFLNNNTSFIDALLNSFFTPTKRHLWFMYAIIGLYISLPFIHNMCINMSKKEENLFLTLWILFVGVLYIINSTINKQVSNPIPIIQGTYYLGYFVSGHIIYKRINEISNKYNIYLILISILCLFINIWYTYHISIFYNSYFTSLFAYRSITYMFPSISIFILVIKHKDKFKSSKLISSISKFSFGIYLIHPIFLDIIKKYINISAQISYLFIPLYTIIIFLLSYISCLLIKKIPLINKILI